VDGGRLSSSEHETIAQFVLRSGRITVSPPIPAVCFTAFRPSLNTESRVLTKMSLDCFASVIIQTVRSSVVGRAHIRCSTSFRPSSHRVLPLVNQILLCLCTECGYIQQRRSLGKVLFGSVWREVPGNSWQIYRTTEMWAISSFVASRICPS
jgi:hypothetical protein